MTLNECMDAQAAKSLCDAADYIEKHGWYRGDYYPNAYTRMQSWEGLSVSETVQKYHPPVCAAGAIYGHAAGSGVAGKILDELQAQLILRNDANANIVGWNDDAWRTKEDVIKLFRETAHRLDPRFGNIGDNPKEYEFEPFPDSEPVREPTPAPATPAPAPAEPEKVPA